MSTDYPALRLNWIRKQKRHQRAFGHRHPMEQKILTGLTMEKTGVVAHGIEITENYTLLNLELCPVPMTINVTRIKEGIFNGAIKFQMARCTNTQAWHDYIFQSCGCEDEHVARLTLEDLKRPAIMIMWDDSMHMTSTIDGSHRICRRWREGFSFFEVAFVAYPDVRQFVTMQGRGDGQGRFA